LKILKEKFKRNPRRTSGSRVWGDENAPGNANGCGTNSKFRLITYNYLGYEEARHEGEDEKRRW